MLVLFCAGIFAASTSLAMEKPYDRIVVFGGSLSDPGNGFVVLSDPSSFGFDANCGPATPMNVPPYDTLDDSLVPDGTYAKGGHHVSNGATWIEQFARNKGLAGSTRPALRNAGQKAQNYAVGGARANEFDCRFNLADQLDAFLASGVELTTDTLVVFEMGGNDVRDALVGALLYGNDPSETLLPALDNIGMAITQLYYMGARKFLLMNVPDIGKAPSVLGLGPAIAGFASILTSGFNEGLDFLQESLNWSLDDIDVRMFDVHSLLDAIIAEPEDYGIEVTDTPCITPNIPPFQCKDPDTYLFWDGLHPTKAVHKIMSNSAAEVLLAPLP
jgi:phospholipase/lecithinase/hemolysin